LLLDPTCAEYHFNLGNSLASEGQPLDAIACYERSLQLNPGLAEAHSSLAYTLYQEGRWEEAIACIERALRLRPEFPEALVNRGLAFQGLGQVEEAIDCYRRALQLRPKYAVAHSDMLVALHYRSGITLKALANAHAQYEERHAAPLRTTWRPHENVRDPDRRLRLGFVSPDLGRHPVGWFLIGVFQNLDRDSCDVICYSDRGRPDDLTSRLRTASTAW
jgi:tetratricopeptide (TPR) repeat protein